MAFTYGFYNSLRGDRKYDALQVSELFDGILADGVIPSQGQLFAVTTSGDSMQINVGTGRAWFFHTWSKNDSVMVLTVPNSDVTRPRIDAVVLEVDRRDDVRANSIKIITGVPAVNAVKPTLLTTDQIHQYPLAYVTVPAAAEVIKAENIENMVGRSPTVFATGVLQTTSLDELWNQWEGEWDTWFSAIKLQLSGDVVTNLQLQIDELKEWDYNIPDSVLNLWGLTNLGSKKAKDVFIDVFKPTLRTETQIFTQNGTWTVPNDLVNRQVLVHMYGGGGGGNSTTGQGGGGGHRFYGNVTLPSGVGAVNIAIGEGGAANSSGGVTSFGSYASASGGSGTDGSGGSGGGGARLAGGHASYGGGGGGGGAYVVRRVGSSSTLDKPVVNGNAGGNGGTYGGGGGGGGGATLQASHHGGQLLGGPGGTSGSYGGAGGDGGASGLSTYNYSTGVGNITSATRGNNGSSGTNTMSNTSIESSARGPGNAGNGGAAGTYYVSSAGESSNYSGGGGGGGGGGGYGGNGGSGQAAGANAIYEGREVGSCGGGGGGGGGYGGKGGNGGTNVSLSVNAGTNEYRDSPGGGGGGGYGGNGGNGGNCGFLSTGASASWAGFGGGGGGGGYKENGGNGGSAAQDRYHTGTDATDGGTAAGGGGGAAQGAYNTTGGAPGKGGKGICILTYSYYKYKYE